MTGPVGARLSAEVRDSDTESEDEGDESGEDEEAEGSDGLQPSKTVEVLLSAVGDYKVPDGWELMPAPANTNPASLKGSNKKIAHRFTDKWWLGIWKTKIASGEDKGRHDISFPVTEEGKETVLWACNLLLADYGVDKKWVMLKRKSTASKKK